MLFKKLNILPLHSQYILSLLLFVVQNIEEFTSNSEVHSINTRHKSDLYPPSIKLTEYQKGVYYSGIKIFNHLPQNKHLSWNVKIYISSKKVSFDGFILYTWWIFWLDFYERSWYFYVILSIYFILKNFIHNLCLKWLMFITSNKLLCSIVITLSN
jgi:hypothetical protein